MDKKVLSVRGVVKNFGKIRALDKVDIEINEGLIFGLIGPNGAGKTTLLRILGTLLKQDEGTVKIFGYDLPENRVLVRRYISYLPEDAGLYSRLSGWENLYYYAMLYYGRTTRALEVAEAGAKISGLSERDLSRKASEYSKGMVRRVAIARTLMIGSRLVILDEPTSGLDVFSAYTIRKILKEYSRSNSVTIILSSHNMIEVEDLCDEVALINKGRIIVQGLPKDLIHTYGSKNLEEVFISLAGEDS
ncbi:MAG: ABC transporter ATP-binding protein [Desulfurococcaceae archaeon TW002]